MSDNRNYRTFEKARFRDVVEGYGLEADRKG